MPSVRSSIAAILRGTSALVMLGLVIGPAPLAATMSGHCGGHHRAQAAHGPAVTRSGAPTGGMGACMPTDCPHCAAAECAFPAPCAGGVTAARAGAMPTILAAGPVRVRAAASAAGLRSLALAPPTPPPLPIP